MYILQILSLINLFLIPCGVLFRNKESLTIKPTGQKILILTEAFFSLANIAIKCCVRFCIFLIDFVIKMFKINENRKIFLGVF